MERLGERNRPGFGYHLKVHTFRTLTAVLAWALVVAAFYQKPELLTSAQRLMQRGIEAVGGAVALLSPVDAVTLGSDRHVVHVAGEAPMELAARVVVNAAGLWAPDVASRMQGLAADEVPRAFFAKGNYFSLRGRAPFSRLVYPVPDPGGLGVHLTLDLAGQGRFGPDVEWIAPRSADDIDYRVDAGRVHSFYAAIRSYWPAVADGALAPAYSGVRPKLGSAQQASADFVMRGPAEHGIAGLVNLFGIESPGVTACLAIADEVSAMLAR